MKKKILIPILNYIHLRYKKNPKKAMQQYTLIQRFVRDCEYFKGVRNHCYRQIVKFKNK